jgi:hypothetical protein
MSIKILISALILLSILQVWKCGPGHPPLPVGPYGGKAIPRFILIDWCLFALHFYIGYQAGVLVRKLSQLSELVPLR